MERLLVLLGSFLLVSVCRGQVLCEVNKCPHSEVLEKSKDYEKRRYEVTDWISTRMEDNDVWAAHYKLKDYVSRQKAHDFNLAVDTWPLLITERPDGRYMSWFLSPNTTKPENNDPIVKLERRPAAIIYVRIFGGTPSLERLELNKEMLKKTLDKEMKDFDHNSYSAATFGPIIKLTHHNEIWIQAASND